MAFESDRNLIYGILAWQNALISESQLLDALKAWSFQKEKPLGEHLVALSFLKSEEHGRLDRLVDHHIELFGGEATRSLAVLESGSVVAVKIREQIEDEEVQESLRHLRSADRAPETMTFHARDIATEVDRFRILRQHAKGGLGLVSVAKDQELGREVALKEIRPEYAGDEENQARFIREAEVTGGLEHPGIVPVYALGHRDDGRPYYAMRLVRGQSLKEAIAEFHSGDRNDSGRNIRFRELLGRFIDVCNAITYAHSRGVLHRDIKPANIMLGKYGETLVVDWGLAKIQTLDEDSETKITSEEPPLIPESGSSTHPTRYGDALGTPAYMSPEQATGKIDDVGPASDVYSLGATLYHILTGKVPFVRSSEVTTMLARVGRGEFPAPRVVLPTVPRGLESVCLKAMATHPDQRYETAADIAKDIERWLADEKVGVHAESVLESARRWLRSHQTFAAATSIGLIIGISTLGWFTTRLQQKNSDLESTITERNAALQRVETESQKRKEANDEIQRQRLREQATSVRVALSVGDYPEVLTQTEALTETARVSTPEYESLLCRVNALVSMDRPVDAKSLLSKLGPAPTKALRAMRKLAEGDVMLFEDTQQATEAIREAREIGLSPAEDAYAQALLAPTLLDSQRLLEETTRLNPLNQRAQALLAMTQFFCGDRLGARETCEFANRIWKDQLDFKIVLFLVESCEGNEEAARSLSEDLQTALPQSAGAIQAIGRTFDTLRRKLAGEKPDFLSLIRLAWDIYSNMKRLDTSIEASHVPPQLSQFGEKLGPLALFRPAPLLKDLYASSGNTFFLYLLTAFESDAKEKERMFWQVDDRRAMVPVRQAALAQILKISLGRPNEHENEDPRYYKAAKELANTNSLSWPATEVCAAVLLRNHDWQAVERLLQDHRAHLRIGEEQLLLLYQVSGQHGRYIDYCRSVETGRETRWAEHLEVARKSLLGGDE